MLAFDYGLGSNELLDAKLILNARLTSLYISVISSLEALSYDLINCSALKTIASTSINYLSFSLTCIA